MTEISLADWAETVATELGVSIDVDVDAVLDLAAAAAHNVIRPAAPLTTFLAGFAAGRAGASSADVVEALRAATALCERVGERDGSEQ